jgi:arylsulfatase A-like enzyme
MARLERTVAATVLILVVGFATACLPARETHPAVVARWLDTDPVEVFKPADHQHDAIVFSDDLGEGSDGRWRSAQMDRNWAQGGFALVGRVDDLDATTVDHFTASVAHSSPGFLKLKLSWAGAGESFVSERSVVLTAGLNDRAAVSKYRFDVAEHPLWKGTIERIRLSAVFPSEIEPKTLVATKTTFPSEGLARMVARPWKVEIANDLRSSMIGVPGLPHTRKFTVPDGARLRMSYGVLGRSRSAIAFHFSVESEGERTVLLNELVVPDELPMIDWREADLDLGSWAGHEVELYLVTETEIGPEDLTALPLWANPEIVATATGAPPFNVVYISVDTLRADRMSLYGHDRPTSPNLERWATESGVVFDNTVVQASWTLPSHVSMLTGIGAFSHGVNHNNPAPASLELISETLRRADYRTLAVTGGGYVHPHYNLSQGFDRFWYWSGSDPATREPVDGADHELDAVLDIAGEWVRESADEPFFLFLHTYDIHYRLRPREPQFSQFSDLAAPAGNLGWSRVSPVAEDGFRRDKYLVLRDGGSQTRLPEHLAELPRDIYDSRIAHMDSQLPRFFRLLDELGLSGRTIIVLTSDHGELLGEHGLYEHLSLYEENIMVPLVVVAPGVASPGSRVAEQVRSVDIVPTILDLLNLPVPDGVEGRSLAPLLSGDDDPIERPGWTYAAASNYGMSLRHDNRAKLIFNNTAWSPVNGDIELYRLDVDPDEENDLGDAEEGHPLRDQLVERYSSQISGLRITFGNSGENPFGLIIEGPGLQQDGVKSVDADCASCVKLGNRGRASVTIPRGRVFSLVLEEAAGRSKPLMIEARRVPGAPEQRRAVVDPGSELEQGLVLVWTGNGWDRGPGMVLPEGETGLVLEWVGARWNNGGEKTDEDAELIERLRALGYID